MTSKEPRKNNEFVYAGERSAQLTQWDLRMLLFTRIASVGYLFNICYSGATQWILNLAFSAFMVILTTYSCYVTIRLRRKHDNKI